MEKLSWRAGLLGLCLLASMMVTASQGTNDQSDLLTPTSVTATSVLAPQVGKTYVPENAIDGNTDTAWIEGSEAMGIGETLWLTFDRQVELEMVEFYNGYGSNYDNNGRLTAVTLVTEDGVIGTYEVEGHWQLIEFSESVTTTSIGLTIASATTAYYEDTAISEVLCYGTVAPVSLYFTGEEQQNTEEITPQEEELAPEPEETPAPEVMVEEEPTHEVIPEEEPEVEEPVVQTIEPSQEIEPAPTEELPEEPPVQDETALEETGSQSASDTDWVSMAMTAVPILLVLAVVIAVWRGKKKSA